MKKLFRLMVLVAALQAVSAWGAVVYFPGPSFYIPPNTDPVSLDMNQDGISDVSFSAEMLETLDYPSSAASLICMVSPDNGAQLLSTNSYAQILATGRQIGDSPSWNSSDLLLTTTTWNLRNGTSSGWSGPLGAVGAGFLGIQFLAADGIHYGWIHVSLTNTAALPLSPQIVDWAYETSSNTPILAGQVSEPVYFEATFNGVNEVPPNRSGHSGTGTFTLESFLDGFVLDYHLELDGAFVPTSAGIFGPANREGRPPTLIAGLGAAQIVFPSPPPPPGPVPFVVPAYLHEPIIILPPPSAIVYDGQITLSSNQVAELVAGQLYVNLTSAKFRQGELRGEIFPTAPISFSATLNSRNEIPRSASTHRGEAAFTLSGNSLSYELALDNFPFMSAGIYASPFVFPSPLNLISKLDIQFGVVIPNGGFPNAPGLPGQTLYDGQSALNLTDEQVYRLERGEFYINVLTPRFRFGEIGGRILPNE